MKILKKVRLRQLIVRLIMMTHHLDTHQKDQVHSIKLKSLKQKNPGTV